jgi:hypothetical protein
MEKVNLLVSDVSEALLHPSVSSTRDKKPFMIRTHLNHYVTVNTATQQPMS